MYDKGQKRLEKELDIARLVVKVRNLHTFFKKKMITERTQVEIGNCYKTVINLDTSSEESESEKIDNTANSMPSLLPVEEEFEMES